MKKILEISIRGMDCISCAEHVEEALKQTPGILASKVSFASREAYVEIDTDIVSEKIVLKTIKRLGYTGSLEKTSQKISIQFFMMITALVLSVPITLSMIIGSISPILQAALASLVQFGCGWSFYLSAYRALRQGYANMDVLVVLGTTAAYFFSLWQLVEGGHVYFETGSLLIAFILIGKVLEEYAQRKATKGMVALLSMQPKTACVKQEGRWTTLPIDHVQKGDVALIKTGENIPIDGVIIFGNTFIDESMLTGESVPMAKGQGDKVFAGTLNKGNTIEVSIEQIESNTVLAKIIALVKESSQSKAPVQKLVDRVSEAFIPAILMISVLTFFIWIIISRDMLKALMCGVAVLVVACPCALGLATPIVILVAIAKGAKEKVLIKNAQALELISKIKILVVDKTGTVTEGMPVPDHIIADDEARFRCYAKALAIRSNHPLAQSLAFFLKDEKEAVVEHFSFFPGKGVLGKIEGKTYFLGSMAFMHEHHIDVTAALASLNQESDTAIILADQENVLGFCTFKDPVRKDVKEVLAEIQRKGIRVCLLSGDRKVVVEKVAKSLGVSEFFAEVLPDAKSKYVKTFKQEGVLIGMVGDGVNDAPALAAADVGFAMGSGTDVAMESASVGLMGREFKTLLYAFKLSEITYGKIRQNLIFAFLYNGLAIPIAAAGFLHPVIAAIAMSLSSISVVLNAISLQRKVL